MENNRKRARVMSVALQKGGVGKSTTVLNLAGSWALAGHKVCVIDADPNANSTSRLGVNKHDHDGKNVVQLMDGKANEENEIIKSIIVSTSFENIDLVPSNSDMAVQEVLLSTVMAGEWTLTRAIKPILYDYDYILIDCPPSLGNIVINCLTASDYVIYAVQPRQSAYEGMDELEDTVNTVIKRTNPSLRKLGTIITMFDSRINSQKAKVEQIKSEQDVIEVIPHRTAIDADKNVNTPIVIAEPGNTAAIRYKMARREIEKKIQRIEEVA